MKVDRVFTKDVDLKNGIKEAIGPWKKVDVTIPGPDGEPIFEMKGAEFPERFSQQACDIIASKYFRIKNQTMHERESSYFDVINRMATFWKRHLIAEGLLEEYSDDADAFYDEIMWMLSHQVFAPNSPQWFNSGLGMFYRQPKTDTLLWQCEEGGTSRYALYADRDHSQTSACFIMGVTDSLEGEGSITDHYVTETRLFKGGSGVGSNFSRVRAAGEPLSGGGTSSGVMSFLDGLDKNAGAIKSGGTTRRAAKMVILNIDHPEIEDFIDWKVREERKAKVLIEAGYDGSMGGEAYSTVSGQNSNNSVRVNAEFMQKVINLEEDPDATITLKGRKSTCVNREVKVADLWEKIAKAAWECADPGIQFDDRYNEWNTCPHGGRINGTNPCSEFAFLDNTACNLASLNLMAFYDPESGGFDFERYSQAIRLSQMVLEASITGGAFPTQQIALNSYDYRPTGLGFTNLASLLLSMKLPYDSNEGRNIAWALSAVLCGASYAASQEMSVEKDPFFRYEENEEAMYDVVKAHAEIAAAKDIAWTDGEPEYWKPFGSAVDDAWKWFFDEPDYIVMANGFRNAQVTVMAPTGTISFAMDCASTGIEPFFSHTVYKKCSDGSFMEITNPLYDDSLPKEVLATAGEISPLGHLKMMAAIQPFISGSISKTVNMPNETTVEDIKETYLNAYLLGLKSVSIYRDGSKGVQPLTTDKEEDEEATDVIFKTSDGGASYSSVSFDAPAKSDSMVLVLEDYKARETPEDLSELLKARKMIKFGDSPVAPERVRPSGIRNSRTHAAKIGEVELYVTVGFYEDGRMAELFASSDKDGTVVKGLLSALSKAISYMLQYGIEPEVIAGMLRNQRYEPSGSVSRHPNIKMADSISDLIAKVIEMECGDYSRCQIKPMPKTDGVIAEAAFSRVAVSPRIDTEPKKSYTQDICPNCGSISMVQSGTCKTCAHCGTTTGCA